MNFSSKVHNKFDMVALTVVMLVMFLSLVPLRIAVSFRLDFAKKCAFARASVFYLPVLSEKAELNGRYLVCSGTVDTEIDVFQMDGQQGINVAKALVFDSVNVTFAFNFCKRSPLVMPVTEFVSFAAAAIGCACSHCRVHTDTCFSVDDCVFGEVVVSVSLAEILIVILKESVRKRRREYGTAN